MTKYVLGEYILDELRQALPGPEAAEGAEDSFDDNLVSSFQPLYNGTTDGLSNSLDGSLWRALHELQAR